MYKMLVSKFIVRTSFGSSGLYVSMGRRFVFVFAFFFVFERCGMVFCECCFYLDSPWPRASVF